MKEQELFEQISKKLSVLIALSFIKDVHSLNIAEGVGILNRFGLNSQEIAEILGTTKGTIDVLKSRIKKNKK